MVEVYSHSRLKCFENCKKQFHFRYVLEIPQETEGIEAFVGKRVHEVLERLYRFAEQGHVPGLPKVLHRYEQLWDAEFDADRVRIVKQGTPVEFYRDLGARCLETYYRKNYPFDGDRTLGIEEKVEFDLDPNAAGPGYRMQGFIDRVAEARDGVIEIHDYKTGRYVPSQKAIDEERQLALYQLGLAGRYGPDRPMRLIWHYVQRGIVRTSTRTPEQLEKLRTATMAVIDEIRTTEDYPPRKIALCDWCEYKPQCPAFNPSASTPLQSTRKDTAPAPVRQGIAEPRQLTLL